MRMVRFVLALVLACTLSVANAQDVRKTHEDVQQQSSAEALHIMQHGVQGLQHITMPYGVYSALPSQTYMTVGNAALLDSSTYKYKPLNLPFAISSSTRSYIGLMDVRSVSGNVQYQLGRMTLMGGLSANRYLYYRGALSQYGVSGQLSYNFSPYASMTLFADYYSVNPFISMAAYPYIHTTRYGGYMTVGGNRFFMNLGVERRYNTINRQMETVPIVTPVFKVSKKLAIGLPFGDFAKYLFMDAAEKRQRPMMPPKRR